VLVFAAVFTPTFAGGEHEPVAHVGDLGRPASVGLGRPVAAAEAFDDVPDLQELGLGILRVVRARQRAFGAGPQFGLEVAHLGVGRGLRFQRDEATGVVVDLRQGHVDARHPFLDGLALAVQLRLEVRHLADGVLVEQVLEARHEARQVVGLQLRQHVPVLRHRRHAGVDVLRFEPEGGPVLGHRANDLLTQARQLPVVGVDALLQPAAHVLFASVTGLHAQRVFAQGLGAPPVDQRKARGMAGEVRRIQAELRGRAQRRRLFLLQQGAGLFGLALLQPSGGLGPDSFKQQQVRRQCLQHVGRGLQSLLLVLQRSQLGGAGAPVELGPVPVLLQLVQCLQPVARLLLLLLQHGDALRGVPQARLQPLDLAFHCRRSWPALLQPST
jgi:hypothetical protein